MDTHHSQSKPCLPARTTWIGLLPALAVLLGISAQTQGEVVAAAVIPTDGSSHRANTLTPSSLQELLALSPAQLEKVDVARMNLLCAQGLPGAEKLDTDRIDQCLATLDGWAERVRSETQRYLHKFRENPAEYQHSEGYFRMLMLVTVLQQDLGVRYNAKRERQVDFANARDLFIHGMIDDDNGGTCVSMPVLYTAITRRLGYPVRLVTTKAHLFCRWDAPDDRVNIEGSSRGMLSFDDDYYKSWPHQITDQEVQANHYLASLTPAEELAPFLAARGHCLSDIGRADEARFAYAHAARLDPKSQILAMWAKHAGSSAHRTDRLSNPSTQPSKGATQ